jgi:hypothetical protein
MYFHCPPDFIERPDSLIAALAAHEVVIKFDSLALQGVGAINLQPLTERDRYEAFRIFLRANRYHANLRVDDVDGMPLPARSPLISQLGEVLRRLGIVPVSSPIEEELDFVQHKFGESAQVTELIEETRIEQQNVAQAVKDTAFERAAEAADRRDALLDQLNSLCRT